MSGRYYRYGKSLVMVLAVLYLLTGSVFANEEPDKSDELDGRYVISDGASLPNLVPYKPSGWSGKIVVSKSTGTTKNDSPLSASDTLYVDWAVLDSGKKAAGAFKTALYVDGVLKIVWKSTSLASKYYTFVKDYALGSLSAGTHTLKIVTDVGKAVKESKESDNSYTKKITISSNADLPNLAPYKPSDWSDKIVVSRSAGTTKDDSPLSASDKLYVDWAVANFGKSAAGTFKTALYVDGVLKIAWKTTSLASKYYTFVKDYALGSLSAGTHTLKIVADSSNSVPESNESDNEYVKSITIAGAAGPGIWSQSGNLSFNRALHTATLLSNGKVLVAGGCEGTWYWGGGSHPVQSELYDPATGQWTQTGNLDFGRHWHTATLLSNGKVLVAGGYGNDDSVLVQSELYDPATGQWTQTGNLNFERYSHTATLLSNGKVLVAGGSGSGSSVLVQSELYDPATGQWTQTGNLSFERYWHTATLLTNGKVLVAGGQGSGSSALVQSELYDPAGGQWTQTGNLSFERYYHTATLLPDGKVLVAGGGDIADTALVQSELYDPAAGQWTQTGNLSFARGSHTATLLPYGKVLVAGGLANGSSVLVQSELYDPAGGQWAQTGNLNFDRYGHAATLLSNGKVLVEGGYSSGSSVLVQSELYY